MKKLYLSFVLASTISFSIQAQSFSPNDYLMVVESPMRVMKSHIEADSIILASIALPVNPADENLRLLISSMYRTVTDSLTRGVGIAAPQVGVSKRVMLVKRLDKLNEPFEAYINPTIIQYTELKDLRSEGCLSIDNFRCEVERPYAILLTYLNIYGEYRIEMVEGFTARIFQHEIDHLDGLLFPERASNVD